MAKQANPLADAAVLYRLVPGDAGWALVDITQRGEEAILIFDGPAAVYHDLAAAQIECKRLLASEVSCVAVVRLHAKAEHVEAADKGKDGTLHVDFGGSLVVTPEDVTFKVSIDRHRDKPRYATAE